MSESKHTPGPWEVEAEGNQKRCIKPVAGWAPIFRSCEETREADLLLAAAAPELLEALEGLLAEVQHLERDYPEDYNFKRYRDVLANAKGTL